MIELEKVKPASRFKRFIANVLDGIIIMLPILLGLAILYLLPTSVLSLSSNVTSAPWIIFFVIYGFSVLVYFPIFESSKYQATPGKKLLGLYVVTNDGGRVSKGRAILRSILYMIPNIVGALLEPV